jgi:hypothetical protein
LKRSRVGLERRRPRAARWATWALAASGVLAIGCNAAIGGGVLALGVVASILTYDCTEGVGVTLWERSTAHPVCDATVVAEHDKTRVTFSPCYSAFLDEGSWTVTATKAGYRAAVGTVTISHERRCSEPTYHSVELTLLRGDEKPGEDRIAPSPPLSPAATPMTPPEPSGESPPVPSPALPEGPAPVAPGSAAPASEPEAPAAPMTAPHSAAFPRETH